MSVTITSKYSLYAYLESAFLRKESIVLRYFESSRYFYL